ncbi:winged helix-turn-helix domain-containing protein [Corynebacterium pollutisoli]|uniref:ArsR/SmtB family transcription factor n=1 Tax=Corynebacterium pollutisoli TaxID=1610489 RepID=UPI000A1CF08E
MGGMTPQTPRDFKDAAFGHTARIGAALGNATRVEIMDVLLQGERSVESLAQQVAASVANTSRHLQILAAAGMVTRRAEGTTLYYRVADDVSGGGGAGADAYRGPRRPHRGLLRGGGRGAGDLLRGVRRAGGGR